MNAHQVIREQELMLARIDELEREIRDMSAARQIYSSRTLEDMPGKKKNLDIPIEIDLVGGSLAAGQGDYTHSESSMYVCTKVTAFWREDGEARWRPVSSVADQEQAPGIINSVDFLWGISEDNNGYNWQPNLLPSSLLQGVWERPFILPIAGQITPSMTINVEIVPTRAPAEDGTVQFLLRGYMILDPEPFQQ